MGQSTAVVSNHNLDVTNVKNLAKDLSIKLQATIIYGYNKNYFIDEDKIDYDYEFNDIETIIYKNATITYFLIDVNLGSRNFIEKYGFEILESENFNIEEYTKESIIKEYESIEYELQEIVNNESDTIIYIYKNTLDLWVEDSIHFYAFQRNFIYKMDNEDVSYLNNWRLKNRKWIALLGGNYMFVFDDEQNYSWLEELLQENTFTDLISIISNKYKEVLVPVSNYMLSKLYEKKPDYVQQANTLESLSKHLYAIENNINYKVAEIKYPTLFYDDFKDLDETITTPNYFDFEYNGHSIFDDLKKQEQFEKEFKVVRRVKELPNLSGYFKLCNFFVAGYKYCYSASFQNNLVINQEVFCVREKENKFDKHAIAVYIDDANNSTDQIKLGYIPQNENYILSKLLDNNYYFKAFLTTINDNEINQSNFNYALKVDIYIEKSNKIEI